VIMARVTLAFSVDSNKDADIVTWWQRLGNQGENRSAIMRAAARAYKDAASVTLGDVLNEIGDVKRMLRSGITIQANGGSATDEQADKPLDPLAQEAQAALDRLAGWE